MTVILNQILNNRFLIYLISIKPDVIYKLINTGWKKLMEEKKSQYFQAIKKLIYLCYTLPNIIFLIHKLAQFSTCSYLIYESALQRIFRYIKYTIGFKIQFGKEQSYLDFNYFTIDYNIIGYAKMSKKGDM